MRVSLVMTAYNATWCITHALDSVLAQTRRPDEVIVCDDGSVDGTPDLIEDRYGSDVKVLRLPHRNASATRRIGLEQATGDWLAFMDADDTWLPEKLERQLAFIEAHPEIRLVSCDGPLVSAEGVIRDSWFADYFDPVEEMVGDLIPYLIERCFVLVSATMVERNAYHEVGGLDPEVVYSHDYDLWLRVLARHPGGIMPDRLVTYFTSPGALSRNYEARHRDNLMLMRRIQGGALGRRRVVQRRAAERAAAMEFDLGLLSFRAGRLAEARSHLRHAAARGPLSRRILSAAGAVLPLWAVPPLKKAVWLKAKLQATRERSDLIVDHGRLRGTT